MCGPPRSPLSFILCTSNLISGGRDSRGHMAAPLYQPPAPTADSGSHNNFPFEDETPVLVALRLKERGMRERQREKPLPLGQIESCQRQTPSIHPPTQPRAGSPRPPTQRGGGEGSWGGGRSCLFSGGTAAPVAGASDRPLPCNHATRALQLPQRPAHVTRPRLTTST